MSSSKSETKKKDSKTKSSDHKKLKDPPPSVSSSKKRKNVDSEKDNKKKKAASSATSGGFDEIDILFTEKKRLDRQEKEELASAAKSGKKKTYSDNDRIQNDVASRSNSSSNRERGNQSVLEAKFGKTGGGGAGAATPWVDDGLGGKFNREGYTGRVEDGVKVFKAHVLNKPGFGQSKDCPFDCDCCFI